MYRGRGGSPNHRGGWRGGKPKTFTKRETQPDPYPDPPKGSLIENLQSPGLASHDGKAGDHIGINDVELIASYNWMAGPGPEIMIPGQPPRWTPPQEQQPLKEDDPNGTYYRDPNAAAFPLHPIEPAIRTIMETHPARFPVQLFACASTMGNLLRFVEGSDKPFRFLVNIVGDVVHFIRREKTPKAQIFGIRGFGHTFPEANTTWDADVAGSTSHQRILRYKFGGIDSLVRFEVDGYLPTAGSRSSARSATMRSFDDDAQTLLDRLNVAFPDAEPLDAPLNLIVEKGGQIVPHDRVFDLKTRGHYYKDNDILSQELPRLWLRQMEHFILAFHKRHIFEDITVHGIKPRVREWERSNQPLISALTELVRAIMVRARAHEDGRVEIVYTGQGPLEVREQLPDAGDMLSDKAQEEWEAWLNSGSRGKDDGEDGGAAKVADANDVEESWDSDSEAGDLTACSKECDFCGKCNY